jgi:gas vesicle protein
MMTINDLRNLDRAEVLGWLGLELKDSTAAQVAKTIGLLTLGLAAGAAVALLFAPKTGDELRGDLRDKFERLRRRSANGANAAREASAP